MSGIYIPGMEMPKELTTILFHVNPEDGTVEIIPSLRYHEKYGDEKQKLPIIPVPPHGRLIDADALLESELGYTIPNYNSDGYVADLEGAYTEVQIENAPTIIPASEEGE